MAGSGPEARERKTDDKDAPPGPARSKRSGWHRVRFLSIIFVLLACLGFWHKTILR
ncbi:hypothetical protein LCGC14_2594020, partial [marine sediment metagenome]